ncbi:hypothetical protein BSL78_21691 [Apostichopus japonicus]|uniref:NLR family CARD domain-containing protein 4 n=1 Tax=Stichopus japonicus TaxID=307972 RepID=A0A2G8K0E4_STIJA|nr:hypothetical protein BSL78_21691 [Apostichopus japonicus]
MELPPELQEKKIFLIEGLKRTYKGQYDAIQPLPYVKDRLYCVDKVFVEGGVEVCLAPELTRGTGGSWESLESYKSIYTDFRFKSKRRIIQGEPGYGKSTLTLQLAYDWCNDVSDSPMNHVEILILLRLRQLGSVKCLFRAIKLFLLYHEPRVQWCSVEVDTTVRTRRFQTFPDTLGHFRTFSDTSGRSDAFVHFTPTIFTFNPDGTCGLLPTFSHQIKSIFSVCYNRSYNGDMSDSVR